MKSHKTNAALAYGNTDEIMLSLWKENPLTRACKGCRYLQPLFGGTPFLICGYLLKTGEPRNCPAGARCTKRAIQPVD